MLNKFKGCLFGFAVGDALGAAVEFMSSSEIKYKYGEDGIHDPQCIISANAERVIVSETMVKEKEIISKLKKISAICLNLPILSK